MRYLLKIIPLLLLLATSCLEDEEEKPDPCADQNWARADQDGVVTCFPNAGISYLQPNTSYSRVQASFYNLVINPGISDPFITAYFDIPASGIQLNTPYPVTAGDYNSTHDHVAGEMTFLHFENTHGATGCIAGTFWLRSIDSVNNSTINFSDGKFVVFSPVSGNDSYDACNPF